MSQAEATRLGAPNYTGSGWSGDNQALFLEKFSNMVLLTFERQSVARQRSTVRTEDWGKAVVTDYIGDATTENHVIGTEILGTPIKQGERTVTPEDMVISSVFVALWDELLNHYEVQGRFADKLGQAIARRYDKDVLRVTALAASDSAATNALDGVEGSIIAPAAGVGPAVNAADLIACGMKAAQALDEKDVPDNNDRTMFVAPSQYYLLLSAGNDLIDRDFGGTGSIERGLVSRLGNLEIVKSNNMADIMGQATQTDDGVTSKYDVDTSPSGDITGGLTALVSTPEAVLNAEWLGITSEAAYDVRRQGTLLLSKITKGTGILRPECSVAIGGFTNTHTS